MALKIDAKFEGKLTCVSKITRGIGKFAQAKINEQRI